MTPEELISALKRRAVWQRGNERAPHKALLFLLALGSLERQEPRLRPYAEIAPALTDLLQRFGPPRKKPHPEAPFLRLEAEVWEVPGVDPAERRELPLRQLKWLRGGLPESVFNLLSGNRELISRVAEILLHSEFEASYHAEILHAVGLNQLVPAAMRQDEGLGIGSSEFLDDVIRAYAYRCAVCGHGIWLHNDLLGLGAAHIQWPAKGGPDVVPNGLALCAIHHKALDRGGISLDDDLNLPVSPQLHGDQAVEALFFELEGKPIRVPRKSQDAPGPVVLAWHRREVYRSA